MTKALPPGFWEEERRRLLVILLPKVTQGALEGVKSAARKAGIALNLELANRAAAAWARKYTDDLLRQLGTTSERLVGDALGAWIEQQGSTMGDLVALLQPRFAENRARADLIAVTEVTRAYANGEKATYLANGITQWRWNTNRDELVCKYCGPLNGQVRAIGEAFGWFRGKMITEPPFHPGCRCWVSPAVGKRRESQDRSRWAEMQRDLEEEMRRRFVMGFSFNQGRLGSVGMAIALGDSDDGWDKHERIFLDDYLPRFNVEDDIERTLGLWETPEPSFNAWLKGETGDIIDLAKAWGKNYNQEAMALLLPDKNGGGGKLIWEFSRELSNEELDQLLLKMAGVNRELAAITTQLGVSKGFQIGLTVRKRQRLEFWYANDAEKNAGEMAIEEAINQANLPAHNLRSVAGFIFQLLFKGTAY